MMKMLDEIEWSPFQIKAIADVYSGHDIYAQERIDGLTPLITAVGTNNGIGYFVGNENDSRAEKSISVVRNGASVSKAFYHKYSALYGNDCRRMKLKYSDSELINLFITQVIGMQNKAFSYSRKLGTERLINLNIMLPVTDSGDPDYEYMSEYVQECRKAMLAKYRACVEARVAELGDYVEIPELNEKEWGSISLNSLFTFERGKEKNMAALASGDIALVSARNVNNGVKRFIKHPTKIIAGGNVLTLNNDGDGGAGLAYYQSIDFALDTHVTALHPIRKIVPEALIFMSASISKQHSIFGHGRSISLQRANRIQIMLPVTDSGGPDYEYMAQYTKNMMLRKYKQYLSYLESRDVRK